MKLKFLFLGMVAAAFMFNSCNNDVIEPAEGNLYFNGEEILPSKGIKTYVAFTLPDKASLRSGTATDAGLPYESQLSGDAAAFIYKWDGTNANPESYAYLTSTGFTTITDKVVLKTTDGTKKIFVALNIGDPTTFFGAMSTTPQDEGDDFSITYSALNRVLWAQPGTLTATDPGWQFTALTPGVASSANGLIEALAGGSVSRTDGLLRTHANAAADEYFLMSNWDNTRKDSIFPPGTSGSYDPTCVFTLLPDVPKSDVQPPGSTKNQAVINVQRAVAKVTLSISAPYVDVTNTWTYVSDAADSTGSKGRFLPWGAASVTAKGYWVIGNINKESTVFQEFQSGSIFDANYDYISCAVGSNDDWYKNFDNTRIYAANTYGTSTVSDVKTTMSTAPNYSVIGADYQYVTENAQAYTAGYQDNSTYALFGGQYIPQFWISKVIQAKVPTNDPMIVYNNYVIPALDSVTGQQYYGPEYTPVPYPPSLSNNDEDSIFYHTGLQLFFYGKDNVAKYYAWVEKRGATDVINQSPTPESEQGIIDEINIDINAGSLIKYFQGNCFYRVFVKDEDAQFSNERVLVRRNHMYDIDIAKILGPGIADPNLIITPEKPVLPVETYLAISIQIQEWHKITQVEEVKGE